MRHHPFKRRTAATSHHRRLTQTQTVLIIYVWCVALAIGGYTVRWAAGPFKAIAFLALFVVTGFMAYWLGLFEAVQHPEERR